MKFQVMTVTPEMAEGWLKLNTSNRVVRKDHVSALASAMRRGEFVANHQAIALNGTKLLDGQHRLMAVIASKLPYVEMSVVTDADSALFETIDIGVKRSNADIFREDVHVMTAINLVGRLLFPKPPTPIQLQPAYLRFKEDFRELVNAAPRSVKRFTSPAIKVAAVASILDGESKQYVHNIYADMCSYNIDRLPKVAQLFVKQMTIDSTIATGYRPNISNQYDMMARAWTVFHLQYADISKLQVKKAAERVQEIREIYRSEMDK